MKHAYAVACCLTRHNKLTSFTTFPIQQGLIDFVDGRNPSSVLISEQSISKMVATILVFCYDNLL